MDKNQLRQHYLALRKQMPQEVKRAQGKRIIKLLKNMDVYKNACTVMTYVSMVDEVDTTALICDMLSEGKKVCAPVCDTQNGTMQAHMVEGFDSLQMSSYGVLEPVNGEMVAIGDIDLIIVPGCVFGRNMHRIGYGKGYYDRYLARKPLKVVTVGLTYGFCVVDHVLAQDFDEKLDYILTEIGELV